MGTTLTWYGHSCFRLADKNCSILIDPFFTGNPSANISWEALPPPDMVLVSHLHHDHTGNASAICRAYGAKLGVAAPCAGAFITEGIPEHQLINGRRLQIGGSTKEKDIRITLTEAYHSTEIGVPCGFIITMPDGVTVYHAGDTDIFANMALWGRLYPVDVAILPTGGFFTMDGRQAARSARMLRAKIAVPMHWGTFPALAQDTKDFHKELANVAPNCAPLEMVPGKLVTL